jgi:hypothetical protein
MHTIAVEIISQLTNRIVEVQLTLAIRISTEAMHEYLYRVAHRLV